MDSVPFHDGNIHAILDSQYLHSPLDVNHTLRTHSSLVRMLSQERELEGHLGCVNAVAWNSKAFGAGNVEVRLFNLSRLSWSGSSDNSIIAPSALYQCHSRKVKKLVVEDGNPNVV
ncbi:hypothetical protein ACSQ67_021152 [Phaseolus vulgaris]